MWLSSHTSSHARCLTVINQSFYFMPRWVSLLPPPSVEKCCLHITEFPNRVLLQSHHNAVQDILDLCKYTGVYCTSEIILEYFRPPQLCRDIRTIPLELYRSIS